jgi:hypothetical protein
VKEVALRREMVESAYLSAIQQDGKLDDFGLNGNKKGKTIFLTLPSLFDNRLLSHHFLLGGI